MQIDRTKYPFKEAVLKGGFNERNESWSFYETFTLKKKTWSNFTFENINRLPTKQAR